MATSLFASPQARQSSALVEFRAGKMQMDGSLVKADTRKGLVSLTQEPSTGIIHITWKDRTSGVVEDDWIVFPDEARLVNVPQCNTGRVFVLDFKETSRKQFFWLQEPKADKDEEYLTKVNQYMNNPPAPGSGSEASPLFPTGGVDSSSLLSVLAASRSAQSSGFAAPGTTSSPSAPPSSAPSSAPSATAPPVGLADLQAILHNLGVPAQPNAPQGGVEGFLRAIQNQVDAARVVQSQVDAARVAENASAAPPPAPSSETETTQPPQEDSNAGDASSTDKKESSNPPPDPMDDSK
mmetsp:Transcript_36418/g.58905  ORF Transcript_36418/g.58905 Transcript_36418/m.58905 type:complete len:295 (+) Transcript_36418:41-925(+)|eukprot:CAMPEP_0184644838 /NCGR_PEP_ID=MMETSP0308-20130426/1471_1 /TAXON_ID=38269 /ORGANISM="Gloeochaete witrockiana, Strain SAG 46.84" /LENGTH=294 /DNA_ID=CAMNT_0027073561 /DNA_START=38 /DNA_END=922 /DNA_ORIENTATION=+